MDSILESATRSFHERPRRRLEREGRAAVLVAAIDDGGPLRLLLTRRSEDLPTHQGQVAFPGGMVGPGERDPVATALREAMEEIALPSAAVEVLALLDDLPTKTDKVAVTPVLGRIASLPALTPSEREVARIFTLPVAELVDAGRWRSWWETAGGAGRWLHAFEHDGEVLWGLSARIVLDLLDRALGASPAPLAPPRP